MIPQRQVGLEAAVCRFGIMGKTYHSVYRSAFVTLSILRFRFMPFEFYTWVL